jgi:hypothetical protein
MAQAWLQCTVTPGQFSSEYAVSAEKSDGSGFSLFAPRGVLKIPQEPSHDSPVEGLLRVDLWDQRGDLVIVRLPAQTLEDGQFVTVKMSQLQPGPSSPNPVANP